MEPTYPGNYCYYMDVIAHVVAKKNEKVERLVAAINASILSISTGNEADIQREAEKLRSRFPMYVIEMAGYCWVCCDNERLDHILSLLRRAFTTVPNPETKVPESIVEINDKSRTTFFARALKIGDVPSDGLYICLRKKKNVPGEHIEFKHI